MKRFLALCLILILSLPALAVDENRAKFVGGTAPGLNAGVVGRLDITPQATLNFEYAGNKLEIPYASVESFQYSREIARHLGVLPAIVVGLLKARQHRHYFRITYRDQNHVAQVVIFEVPKSLPRTLQPVLEARSPHTIQPKPCSNCSSCSDWGNDPTWSNF